MHDDPLTQVVRRPGWQADALCREYPDVDYFPSPGRSSAAAKKICARCLVRAECLSYALELGPEVHGIFGGTTARERARMRPAGSRRQTLADLPPEERRCSIMAAVGFDEPPLCITALDGLLPEPRPVGRWAYDFARRQGRLPTLEERKVRASRQAVRNQQPSTAA